MEIQKGKAGMADSIVDYARYLKTQDISGTRIVKMFGRFLEEKARERGIPVGGYFELTPLCNLDCRMCYVHLDARQDKAIHLLSVDEWKSLMEQAYRAGMRKATLTGGECLTYPGFDDLFLFLRQLDVNVAILTNGVLMDQARVAFFQEHPPEYIQVSLYGSNEAAYEKVTGHRVFGKVMENLKLLRKAGLKVQLTITPSRFMLEDMRPLVELAHSLGFPFEINCRLIPPRQNTGRKTEDLTLDQYVDIYRIRAEMLGKGLIPNDPTELPDENHTGKEWQGLLCGAGRSAFAIRYDGHMMPCVSLDDYSVSVLELGFQKAWEAIHQYAVNFPTPCECNGCVYFPVCIHCQGLHKLAPAGHCDRQICKRTKRMAEAGFLHYKGKPSEQKKQSDK